MSIAAVAWPSISESLGLPIENLGYLSLAYGIGYTTATFVSGWVSERLSSGRMLIVGAALAAAGCGAAAVSPTWEILLAASTLFGLGAGGLDAAGNAYVAVRGSNREMGSLHGLFGIGAIIGPLVVTGLIAVGLSWRASFVAVGAAYTLTAILMVVHARDVAIPTKRSTGETGRLAFTSRLFWSLTIFVVYAGIAASTGIWAFTFLTEYKGVPDGLGGLIVAGYWGAFAGSRFVFASIGDRYDSHTLMRTCLLAAVVGYGAFWIVPWAGVSVVALLFAGFSHGPFFPLQLLETTERFGSVRAPGVIGFQIAGANIGGAVIPALIGVLVGWFDLAVVPPALVLFAALTFATSEVLNRVDTKHQRQSVESPTAD